MCPGPDARGVLGAAVTTAPDCQAPGDILAEMTQGEEGGAAYDTEWHARAQKTMW